MAVSGVHCWPAPSTWPAPAELSFLLRPGPGRPLPPEILALPGFGVPGEVEGAQALVQRMGPPSREASVWESADGGQLRGRGA